MRRAVRIGLVVLGAVAAVYGAASLTGGWLGTPPWWIVDGSRPHPGGNLVGAAPFMIDDSRPRAGREAISVGLVVAGAMLVVAVVKTRFVSRLALAAGAVLAASALSAGLGLWGGPTEWRARRETRFEFAVRVDEIHPLAGSAGPVDRMPWPEGSEGVVARADLRDSAWMLLPVALALVAVGAWPRRRKAAT